MKSSIQVELVDFFVGLKYRLDCSVGEVVNCCEADLSAERQEEWYLIYEEDVRRHGNLAMEFEKVFRNLNKILGHMSCFRACGLSFECGYIFAPYFIGRDNVVNGYWTVFDLTALDNPFEVFH
jgi:hypothetical protein